MGDNDLELDPAEKRVGVFAIGVNLADELGVDIVVDTLGGEMVLDELDDVGVIRPYSCSGQGLRCL